VCVCVCVYIYIYIYIYREREREFNRFDYRKLEVESLRRNRAPLIPDGLLMLERAREEAVAADLMVRPSNISNSSISSDS